MKFTINYDPNPKPDETKIIWEGISENAKIKRNFPSGRPFAFFIKDELNKRRMLRLHLLWMFLR